MEYLLFFMLYKPCSSLDSHIESFQIHCGATVWVFSTLIVQNYLEDDQVGNICLDHTTNVDPFLCFPITTSPLSTSLSGESVATSNQECKKKKRNNKKKQRQGGNHPTTAIHVGEKHTATTNHVGGKKLATTSHFGGKQITTASHVGGNEPATTIHVRDSNTIEKPSRIRQMPKFPCKFIKGDHLTYLCPILSKEQRVCFQSQGYFSPKTYMVPYTPFI